MNFRPFNGHQNIKKKHRKQTEMFEHKVRTKEDVTLHDFESTYSQLLS